MPACADKVSGSGCKRVGAEAQPTSVMATMAAATLAIRFDPPEALLCVLFIPDRPLATREMRAALPASRALGESEALAAKQSLNPVPESIFKKTLIEFADFAVLRRH